MSNKPVACYRTLLLYLNKTQLPWQILSGLINHCDGLNAMNPFSPCCYPRDMRTLQKQPSNPSLVPAHSLENQALNYT